VLISLAFSFLNKENQVLSTTRLLLTAELTPDIQPLGWAIFSTLLQVEDEFANMQLSILATKKGLQLFQGHGSSN